LVVFDAATCVALRAAIQPEVAIAEPVSSETGPNPLRDDSHDPRHPCPALIEVKTTSEDQMCDLVAAACASQIARLCPSRLGDPQHLGN
jgi:hypothetical protein